MGRQRVESDGRVFGEHKDYVMRTQVGCTVLRGKPEVVLTIEPQTNEPRFYEQRLSPDDARRIGRWLIETADSIEKNGPATIEMFRKDDEREL
jgi:hypothetical protein